MTKEKKNGAYYTPEFLADFIVKRVLSTKIKIHKILEPSAGDGIFIKSFIKNIKLNPENISSFDIIEKNTKELKKIISYIKCANVNINFNYYSGDFLTLYKDLKNKYEVIFGNPPYIKKELLYKYQIRECNKIYRNVCINHNIKNIWPAFLLACTDLLSENGILAFVLPTEFLQVKFTNIIREFLTKKFEKIEIVTFKQLLFSAKGQDTILFLGYKKSNEKGIFYSNIEDLNEISEKGIIFKNKKIITNNTVKWTHHYLEADELELIFKLKSDLNSISDFITSKPGIVTGANDFFIVEKDTIEEYKMDKYAFPIIQKGIFVNGSVQFFLKDFTEMLNQKLPSYFLKFDNKPFTHFSNSVQKYLKSGYKNEIHKRYKTSNRDRWFVVPNIVKPSDGFFFKRSHLYPKLLKNNAKILITDSAYSISMKNGYRINDFIYSFYNSLTLSFAELEGRYYGGGVLELTPSEFKNLKIPFTPISDESFRIFSFEFKCKEEINEILTKNDNVLLSGIKLDSDSIYKIQKIRGKLLRRRLRK